MVEQKRRDKYDDWIEEGAQSVIYVLIIILLIALLLM